MAGYVVLIIIFVSAVVGFVIMAAAVAVGMIAAQGTIDRRRAREANRGERVTNKPSEVRARREAQKAQAVQQRAQPPAQPPKQPPPQEPSTPSEWR